MADEERRQVLRADALRAGTPAFRWSIDAGALNSWPGDRAKYTQPAETAAKILAAEEAPRTPKTVTPKERKAAEKEVTRRNSVPKTNRITQKMAQPRPCLPSAGCAGTSRVHEDDEKIADGRAQIGRRPVQRPQRAPAPCTRGPPRRRKRGRLRQADVATWRGRGPKARALPPPAGPRGCDPSDRYHLKPFPPVR
jgi:hypothetical protein